MISILLICIFVFVLLTAFTLNAIVLYMLASRKCSRYTLKISSVTRLFMISMTLADFLNMILVVPFIFYFMNYKEWNFGLILCKLVPFVQMVSITIVSYSLSAIAIQWYSSPIVKPNRSPVSLKQALCVLVSVWVMALFVSSPMFTYHQIERLTTIKETKINMVTNIESFELEAPIFTKDSVTNASVLNLTNFFEHIDRIKEKAKNKKDATRYEYHNICMQKWTQHSHSVTYYMEMFIIQHVVPILICAFTYTRIVQMIWCKSKQQNSIQDELVSSAQISSSDRMVVKMMSTCTALFLFGWLPLNILSLSIHLNMNVIDFDHFFPIWNVCSWLAESHAFYKPLIYICLNDNFSTAFQQVFVQLGSFSHPFKQFENEQQSDDQISIVAIEEAQDAEQMRYSVLDNGSTSGENDKV